MNVDGILESMNRCGVNYLLMGGINFLLRHEPVLTFDVDLWIEDTPANRDRCRRALEALDASWGESEAAWGPVRGLTGDWLGRHGVFCLISSAGPVDIFRSVRGLPEWPICAARAFQGQTPAGTWYRGLSDEDMLACQMALEEPLRKLDRVRVLKGLIDATNRHAHE